MFMSLIFIMIIETFVFTILLYKFYLFHFLWFLFSFSSSSFFFWVCLIFFLNLFLVFIILEVKHYFLSNKSKYSSYTNMYAWQYILYYNSFLASVELGMVREGEGWLRSFPPLLQLLVIWALIRESTSIQSSGNIFSWLCHAFWDLGPEAGLFSGLCLSSWDARGTRGQLSWSCWLPSGCLGSLTGMEILFYTKKCWGCGQRGVSKDSCSVSGFWGIPWWAWQGISSFQHCKEAAISWLRLSDIVDPVEIGCDFGVYSWGTWVPTAMAPAHNAYHLPQVRVIHQGPTTVTLAGVHTALQNACTQHLLGDFPLVCILCIASSSVNDPDWCLKQCVRQFPSTLFCKAPSNDP